MNRLEPQELAKEIKSGRFRPVYVLFGKDRYRMEQCLDLIANKMFTDDERDMGTMKFDTSEQALQEIVYEADSPSFFLERKLIVVKDSQLLCANTKDAKIDHKVDSLLQYLEHPLESSVIVFIVNAEKLDERKKLVKILKDRRCVINFTELDEPQLIQWLIRRASEQNRHMDREAAELLIQRVGQSMQQLSLELDKACLHIGENGQLTADTIAKLTTATVEEDVFGLVDAIVNIQLDKARAIYSQLLVRKEEPIKIVALIARQLRMMLQIKELSSQHYSPQQIAGHIGAHPYAVKLAAEKAARFQTKQLAELLNSIADLDYSMKTGIVDKNLGLELFILSVGSTHRLSFINSFS